MRAKVRNSIYILVLLSTYFGFYAHTYASVIMNEIAWMGTATSANDEWIELYNDQSGVISVDGWKLSDGVSLSIPLAGSIAGNTYAVLERTDDDSAPGSAFLIYTGSLANDGRTLKLINDTGAVVDQVAGGDGWQNIGGDNETKETPQRTSVGWITAEATPGKQNKQVSSATHEDDEVDNTSDATENDSQNTHFSSSSKNEKEEVNESISLVLPDTTLELAISIARQGYVDQPTHFVVEPDGIAEGITDSLQYTWNFGDGTTATGKDVFHPYEFAGNYAVGIEASYARHHAIARSNITILPVSVSLGTDREGNVQFYNNARYEVDISGLTISDGDMVYTFPPNTIILPNATITFSAKEYAFSRPQNIFVMDQDGDILTARASIYSEVSNQNVVTAKSLPARANLTQSNTPATIKNNSINQVAQVEKDHMSPVENVESTIPADTQQAQVFDENPKSQSRYLIGLGGVLLIGVLALYAHRLV